MLENGNFNFKMKKNKIENIGFKMERVTAQHVFEFGFENFYFNERERNVEIEMRIQQEYYPESTFAKVFLFLP